MQYDKLKFMIYNIFFTYTYIRIIYIICYNLYRMSISNIENHGVTATNSFYRS